MVSHALASGTFSHSPGNPPGSACSRAFVVAATFTAKHGCVDVNDNPVSLAERTALPGFRRQENGCVDGIQGRRDADYSRV